jgi:hypothetical protein
MNFFDCIKQISYNFFSCLCCCKCSTKREHSRLADINEKMLYQDDTIKESFIV